MNNIENLIEITEFGAAERVPGSKLLFNTGKEKILVDMGLEYKDGEEDTPLPFDATSIDYLLLDHGHADHMGQILKLLKGGFDGEIFSTHQTVDITKLQLGQQVNGPFIYNKFIKGKKYKYGPKKGWWIPFKKIKYVSKDVKNAMGKFKSFNNKLGFPYEEKFKVSDNVDATFFEAGHIPGSAQILLNIKQENKKPKKVLVSYDLGRTDYKITKHPIADIPIVKFPHIDFPKDIDYIVIESTYGNRVHGSLEDSIGILEEAINDAAKHKGKLVIPAFSVMRTHMLWNFFYRLDKEGRLPKNWMFYSSSPTANKVAKIILKYADNFDERAVEEFKDKNNNPFNFNKLIHHRKMADTLKLLRYGKDDAYCINASSGMCDFGRIVGVLKKTINDPKNIILATGYAAPGTRMWKMMNNYKQIPFNDTIGKVDLRADVRKMGGLSGHADVKEIIAHLKNIKNPEKGEQFKGIYIKHGEKEACYAQQREIIKAGFDPKTVHVMKKGQAYKL